MADARRTICLGISSRFPTVFLPFLLLIQTLIQAQLHVVYICSSKISLSNVLFLQDFSSPSQAYFLAIHGTIIFFTLVFIICEEMWLFREWLRVVFAATHLLTAVLVFSKTGHVNDVIIALSSSLRIWWKHLRWGLGNSKKAGLKV